MKEAACILDAIIVSRSDLTKSVFELWLEAPPIAERAKPGQFVSIHLGKDHLIRRPFSIAGTNGGNIRLVIKKAGRITSMMSALTAGQKISVMGPLGESFKLKKYERVLCVAGGIGIAPMLFLFQKEIKNQSFYLVLGVKNIEDTWYEDVYLGLSGFLLTTEDGSSNYPGRPTDYLLTTQNIFNAEIMLGIGPLSMLKNLSATSKNMNIESVISLENYMGCGLGACNSCLVHTKEGWKKTCIKGPAFKVNDIDFESLEAKA